MRSVLHSVMVTARVYFLTITWKSCAGYRRTGPLDTGSQSGRDRSGMQNLNLTRMHRLQRMVLASIRSAFAAFEKVEKKFGSWMIGIAGFQSRFHGLLPVQSFAIECPVEKLDHHHILGAEPPSL